MYISYVSVTVVVSCITFTPDPMNVEDTITEKYDRPGSIDSVVLAELDSAGKVRRADSMGTIATSFIWTMVMPTSVSLAGGTQHGLVSDVHGT
jgi:hypothetical protein